MAARPPIAPMDLTIAQEFYKLSAGLGGGVNTSGIAWVDGVYGNDGTAQLGSLSRKYKTVQAAANAIPNVGSVVILPGSYGENVVLKDLGRQEMRGLIPETVAIVSANANPALKYAPSIASGSLLLANLFTVNTSTGVGLQVRPDLGGGTLGKLLVQDVIASSPGGVTDADIHKVDFIQFEDFNAKDTGLFLKFVKTADISHCDLKKLTVDAQGGTQVFNDQGITVHNGSVVRSLVLLGAPTIYIDPTVSVMGATTGTLTIENGGTLAPNVRLEGVFGEQSSASITLSVPEPINSGDSYVHLDGGKFYGPVVITTTAAVNPQTVTARGAWFYEPGCTVTIPALVNLDVRGAAQFDENSQVAAMLGTLDRDQTSVELPVAPAAPNGVFPWAFPFPAWAASRLRAIPMQIDQGGGNTYLSPAQIAISQFGVTFTFLTPSAAASRLQVLCIRG
jgi:hypothetical protein